MKNKFIKSVSLLLAGAVLASGLAACGKKGGGGDGGEKPSVSVTDPDPTTNVPETWESKHPDIVNVPVPEYNAISADLVKNGEAQYTIVVADDISAAAYTAVTELNYFMSLATGTSFPVMTDTDATWSSGAKYISIGKNEISTAAGMSIPDTLNAHGFGVKTIDSSLMLQGVSDYGNVYAVYDVLGKILNYEFYHGDEISLAKTKTVKCPDFDYTDEPDIEYRSSAIGYCNGMISTRFRMNSVKFAVPENASTWHNSFDYIPYETYSDEHSGWFADNLKNLCYTAHGDTDEYSLLVKTVADKMKKAIADNPTADTVTFTHEDEGTWCSCKDCAELKTTYGTDSASMIRFMNDVSDNVEAWREDTYPERDNISYVFFAYTATVKAPTKTENGKIVAIDQTVQPHDHVGVMYAPISSDFIHGKNEPQNATYLQQMNEWHALVGDNIYYWFYQSYFYNYFLWYNNFDSMQDNYRAAVDNGAVWMYDQSQYNNANSSGFQLLKAYLSSKLMWNTEEDVTQLTDNYFDNYFRAASDSMRELFNSIRLNYLWMSENEGVSGWIGIRIDNSDYFKLNTLLEWQKLVDKAYADIEYLKASDPAMYKTLYDRIRLESLSVRYLIIDLYGTQYYTSQELYDRKLEFKKDCSELNVTRLGEALLITSLWSQWGI